MFDLKQRSITNPLRHRQLVQLRFYLRHLLNQCSNQYVYTGNQYGVLIGRLLDIKGDAQVTFVTFNYDTLIEQAMIATGIMPSKLTLQEYLKAPIPLIKPHGSTQWVYRLRSQGGNPKGREVEWLLEQYPMQEPDISKIPIQIDEEWNMNGNLRSFETPYVYYPAIAIPLNQKTEFVCPPEHIASLEAALETAKHVVTVGWRGSEDRFCRLLQTHCPKNKIRLHVVS